MNMRDCDKAYSAQSNDNQALQVVDGTKLAILVIPVRTPDATDRHTVLQDEV